MNGARRIGFTSTVPVEAVLAAGAVPVDMNNLFINHPDRDALLAYAESRGFPRNVCSWIKGIYSLASRDGAVDELIWVAEGDCSNTRALAEVLAEEGVLLHPFSYPLSRSRQALASEIAALCERLGTTPTAAESAWERLAPLRALLHELDRLGWETGTPSAAERFSYLVSASDFCGDPARFRRELEKAVSRARDGSAPAASGPRVGLAGVPPAVTDVHEVLEGLGAQVVFDEIPRQFTLPAPAASLVDSYLAYTYPYDVSARLDDIAAETARRRIAGLIHYSQAFCHRQIEEILLRRRLKIPVLSLEGDRPGSVDARTRLRLEAFVSMLEGNPR